MEVSVGAKRGRPSLPDDLRKIRNVESRQKSRRLEKEKKAELKEALRRSQSRVQSLEKELSDLKSLSLANRKFQRRLSADYSDQIEHLDLASTARIASIQKNYRAEVRNLKNSNAELQRALMAAAEDSDLDDDSDDDSDDDEAVDEDLAISVAPDLVEAVKDLIGSLPLTHVLRTRIRSAIVKRIGLDIAVKLFGGDIRQWNIAASKVELPLTRSRRYRQNQNMEVRRSAFLLWLDDYYPITSGRDYRIISCEKQELYKRYVKHCDQQQMPTLSMFTFTLELKKLRIHWTVNPHMCPHCQILKDYKAVEGSLPNHRVRTALRHSEIFQHQRNQFFKSLDKLRLERRPDAHLLVQDFSGHMVDGRTLEELIIVCYTFDNRSKDKLRRDYFHVVPTTFIQHDILFVDEAWKLVFREAGLLSSRFIEIWSDGGPKHFKITSNLCMWLKIQMQLEQCDIRYNFFASYHGYSCCDASASHLKRHLISYRRNVSEPIDSVRKFTEVAKTAPFINLNTITVTLSIRPTPKTIHGIKKCHSFKFGTSGIIFSRPLTSDDEENWTETVITLDDSFQLKCNNLFE